MYVQILRLLASIVGLCSVTAYQHAPIALRSKPYSQLLMFIVKLCDVEYFQATF